MTINVHDKGDRVRIDGTFKDINDDLIDPTGVTLKVVDPSGNTTTYEYGGSPEEVLKTSTGVYYADVDVDEEGDWYYKWFGTGTGIGTDEGQFVVKPTQF